MGLSERVLKRNQCTFSKEVDPLSLTVTNPWLNALLSGTASLPLGGVLTVVYNPLFARRHGGAFILRIEDTDQARYVAGAEEYIIDSLKWCGLDPDEGPHKEGKYGPYRQSERKALGIYAEYAK